MKSVICGLGIDNPVKLNYHKKKENYGKQRYL